jgi:moderate conductance mechanosensitive channel
MVAHAPKGETAMEWTANALEYLQEHWVEIATRIGAAAVILVGSIVLASVLARLAGRSLERDSRRGATLASIVRTSVRIVVIVLGAVMALDQLGIQVGAILAGAGILGLAVGFGAQSLVKDVISGFFLILDDALSEGDIADVGGEATGVVESVGLRVTRVRAFNGQLWYVQNGEIRKVGNFSREWTRAVVEVNLAYEQDIAKGLGVLQRVGDGWAAEHQDLVLEPPEVHGALGFNASEITVRLVIKVKAPNHWGAERELRGRIKAAFDEAGVEIPFPRSVVYHKQDASDAIKVVGPNGAGAAERASASRSAGAGTD